jgi:capsular exopolysaccharide synthesis family protein
VTLHDYLQILRKRWTLITTVSLLSLAVAAGVTLLTPLTYSAQASAFVTITSTGTEANSLYQNSQFALQRVTSYPQVISSPQVLQPVIDTLHLKVSLSDLQKAVTAENPPDTVLLNVVATSRSPQEAQLIANTAADRLGSVIERLETSRAGGVAPVKVTTAVPAALPQSPVSPRPPLNLALGLLVGLALGTGAAVIREKQDTSVKGDDLQELTGTAPLGNISFDPHAAAEPLMALRVQSPALEAFRTMRTNLQFVDVDKPPRQFVITSAREGEGKTTTACNLAITLAQSALSVCLIEADLRRPKVATYLEIDGSVGLTNVLAGQFSLDDMLVPWNQGQLTVLPAGTPPPDPSQLLGSKNMTILLEELRHRFDMVIIDAPPLLPVTDAAVLAHATDGALFVCRHGHTSRELVAKALENLQTVNAALIGTVLTFVPSKAAGYGYGYGYSIDESPERSTSRWRHGRSRRRAARGRGLKNDARSDRHSSDTHPAPDLKDVLS